MIDVKLCAGNFGGKQPEDIESIAIATKQNSEQLRQMPIGAIIEVLNEYSKKFLTDPKLRNIEGANYLSLWLKRKNLTDIINLNLQNVKYLDEFVEIKENQFLKAQPRGLVCHWIAGNVPTLALFSLIQSMLCKNSNIMKVPSQSIETITEMLRGLEGVSAEYEDKKYYGKDLLKSVSVIYFSRTDLEANRQLSLVADAKVYWGGKQAIEAIKALPTQEHCEDIIFGPKYSFGVFDKEFIETEDLAKLLNSAIMDIIVFDQNACSSPQVLFFEKNSKFDIKQIAEVMAGEFEKISQKFPKAQIEAYTASRIINARGEYLLDETKDIIASRNVDWTILINKNISLEEPVQSRTIFVKEVNDLFEIPPLITRKIQTIGIAIKDLDEIKRFCDEVTSKGAARCVRFGTMNNYSSPWDGMLVLNRLSRFVTIKR